MKNGIIIFFFTLGVTLFYNWVGQLVPQKEVHPPKTAEISGDMSTEEMVAAGKLIVEGKGTCLSCHNGSKRFPVLEGIGARAATEREGMDDVEYLAEALYEPNAYIVEPFAPGMPAVNKPPIGLTDDEVLVSIAYLQSLGGTPSVTMKTKLKYQGQGGGGDASGGGGDAAPAAPAVDGGDKTGEQLVAEYGCMGCHSFTGPDRMLGPSLYDIGKRLSVEQLYVALMDPDAEIAEGGYPPAVMGATLNGNGFYTKLSTKQFKVIMDHLVSLKGGE